MSNQKVNVIALVRDDVPAALKAEMKAQGIKTLSYSKVLEKEAAYVNPSATSTIQARAFMCVGAKQITRDMVEMHVQINLSILYGMQGLKSLRTNSVPKTAQRFGKAVVEINEYVDGQINPTYHAAQRYARAIEDLGITQKADHAFDLVAGSGAYLCALDLVTPESFMLFEINMISVPDTSNGIFADVLAIEAKNLGDGQTCGARLLIDKLMLNNIGLSATTGSVHKVKEVRNMFTFASLTSVVAPPATLVALANPLAIAPEAAPEAVAAMAPAGLVAAIKVDLDSEDLPSLF